MNDSTTRQDLQFRDKDFWSSIDTVLLDMDGTLLDLHFDNYFWQTILPKQYSQLNSGKTSFNDLSKMYADKAGTLDWYCVDFWSNTLAIDVMALKQDYRHLIAFRPGVIEFLEFLLEEKITPVLVTNAHRKALALKLNICPLNNWIPHIYSSHDFGLPKEHPDFWATFSQTYPFDKERSVFIDDNESVLNAAHSFGIKHLFSIEQPDSQRDTANSSNYLRIKNFIDIF